MKFTVHRANRYVKILLSVYVVAGFFFRFAPAEWFPSTYMLPLMSNLAIVSAFFIVLPAFVFKPDDKREEDALRRFQSIIAFALVINGIGGLGLYNLYKYGFQYDKLTHYITPLILTVGWIEFISAWRNWNKKKVVIFVSAAVFIGGFVWEFLEFYSDMLLGTTLVGLGGGTNGSVDTMWDIVFNTLGIISGIIYIYFKGRKSSAVASMQRLKQSQLNAK